MRIQLTSAKEVLLFWEKMKKYKDETCRVRHLAFSEAREIFRDRTCSKWQTLDVRKAKP